MNITFPDDVTTANFTQNDIKHLKASQTLLSVIERFAPSATKSASEQIGFLLGRIKDGAVVLPDSNGEAATTALPVHKDEEKS